VVPCIASRWSRVSKMERLHEVTQMSGRWEISRRGEGGGWWVGGRRADQREGREGGRVDRWNRSKEREGGRAEFGRDTNQCPRGRRGASGRCQLSCRACVLGRRESPCRGRRALGAFTNEKGACILSSYAWSQGITLSRAPCTGRARHRAESSRVESSRLNSTHRSRVG